MFIFILLLLCYDLFIYYSYKHYYLGEDKLYGRQIFWVLLILIFFGVWGTQQGDWVHYREILLNLEKISHTYTHYSGWLTHMERIYVLLAKMVNYNYWLWRIVLYSFQFLLFFYFLKKTETNNWETIFLFALIGLKDSVFGRFFWGVLSFFYGLYLFQLYKKKRYLVFLVLAGFAHSTISLLYLFLPFCLFRINKKIILFSVLVIPITALAIFKMMGDFSTFQTLLGIKLYNGNIQNYFQVNQGERYFGQSLGEMVIFIPQRLAMLVLLFSIFRCALKNEMDEYLKPLIMLTYMLSYFCFVVLVFNLGGTIFYRYFMMLSVPVVILLPKVMETNNISWLWMKISCYLLLLSLNASFLVSGYYNIIN